MAKLYQDPSIGNAISIVVTRLIFLTADDVSLHPGPRYYFFIIIIYFLACLLCQLHKILNQTLDVFKLLLVSLKPLLSSYRVSEKSTDSVCICVSVLTGFQPLCVCV